MPEIVEGGPGPSGSIIFRIVMVGGLGFMAVINFFLFFPPGFLDFTSGQVSTLDYITHNGRVVVWAISFLLPLVLMGRYAVRSPGSRGPR